MKISNDRHPEISTYSILRENCLFCDATYQKEKKLMSVGTLITVQPWEAALKDQLAIDFLNSLIVV